MCLEYRVLMCSFRAWFLIIHGHGSRFGSLSPPRPTLAGAVSNSLPRLLEQLHSQRQLIVLQACPQAAMSLPQFFPLGCQKGHCLSCVAYYNKQHLVVMGPVWGLTMATCRPKFL